MKRKKKQKILIIKSATILLITVTMRAIFKEDKMITEK